jgi:Glyoxalase-like domain
MVFAFVITAAPSPALTDLGRALSLGYVIVPGSPREGRTAMATDIQVVIDCADPDRMMTFWAAALGYKEQDPPDGYGSWEDFLRAMNVPEDRWNSAGAVVDPEGKGPRIYFQRVPEPKTVKNRVHLDLNVSGGRATPADERRRRVDAEVERLKDEGATVFRPGEVDPELGEYWVVMQDVEGNEFCVQ